MMMRSGVRARLIAQQDKALNVSEKIRVSHYKLSLRPRKHCLGGAATICCSSSGSGTTRLFHDEVS